jgi:hypothetical protein
MKSRVFTIISLFSLVVAMAATSTAVAQSPAQDVYNPNGEVLDVVQGGGTDEATNDTAPVPPRDDDEVCASADGRDAGGNVVSFGSSADCATATPAVSTDELPFTGFQAGLVGLAGAVLLGSGFAMRRVSRRSTSS